MQSSPPTVAICMPSPAATVRRLLTKRERAIGDSSSSSDRPFASDIRSSRIGRRKIRLSSTSPAVPCRHVLSSHFYICLPNHHLSIPQRVPQSGIRAVFQRIRLFGVFCEGAVAVRPRQDATRLCKPSSPTSSQADDQRCAVSGKRFLRLLHWIHQISTSPSRPRYVRTCRWLYRPLSLFCVTLDVREKQTGLRRLA